MGHYNLVSFKMDEEALNMMRADKILGRTLYNFFTCRAGSMSLRISQFEKSPKNLPDPLPVLCGAYEIGEYIGNHYDGCPTGTSYAPAPTVKPEHIVFTFFDSNNSDVLKIKSELLITAIEIFKANPEMYKNNISQYALDKDLPGEDWQTLRALTPIFINDTDNPAPLHTLKCWTFQPGEEALAIESGGYPFCFPEDHVCPRRASDMRYTP